MALGCWLLIEWVGFKLGIFKTSCLVLEKGCHGRMVLREVEAIKMQDTA